jgi:hypothetical protein
MGAGTLLSYACIALPASYRAMTFSWNFLLSRTHDTADMLYILPGVGDLRGKLAYWACILLSSLLLQLSHSALLPFRPCLLPFSKQFSLAFLYKFLGIISSAILPKRLSIIFRAKGRRLRVWRRDKEHY